MFAELRLQTRFPQHRPMAPHRRNPVTFGHGARRQPSPTQRATSSTDTKRCSNCQSVTITVGASMLSIFPSSRNATCTTESWLRVFHARAVLVLRKFGRCVARCASAVSAPRARVLLGKSSPAGHCRSSQACCPGETGEQASIPSLSELFLQRVADIGCITSFRHSPSSVHCTSAWNGTRVTLMAAMYPAIGPLIP